MKLQTFGESSNHVKHESMRHITIREDRLLISPYLNLKVNAPVLVVRMCMNFHIMHQHGFDTHTAEISGNLRKNDFTGSRHGC